MPFKPGAHGFISFKINYYSDFILLGITSNNDERRLGYFLETLRV